ncbi:serine/threonine-protein phosphatase 1 regulatory subunit 10-like [Frankliniella occidentalis]|uniref:Serine/threonine-protein phosphatase 1 regulatory subunit 10-like n=1 Tax=Frankliniella occidentalis TaxID=133901 RepID=A0A6J1SZQ6_FRAOC|nr:serine/threonine-protein phosphatase 1 regulatory subunit 10-like [Frankliniella occidentalis]
MAPRAPLVLAVVMVAAALALAPTCSARALAKASSYGSSIYHVTSGVPSSHQSVTLSEERVVHTLDHQAHPPHALERSHDHALDHDHDHSTPYKFEYKVHDQKNHNYYERAESSDGQVVRGFYSLLEPHGEVRVVKYRADHDGFQSEVSRHGSHLGDAHGGGLGATIGVGASHDLGSHGLGVSASAPIPSPVKSYKLTPIKTSIPIHEEAQEDSSNQWSAIEDPKKQSGTPIKSQALEEIPAPSQEALGKPPGGGRVPEQFLLQQQKKKKAPHHALQHPKPPPHLHKFQKRPPHPFGPGPRPGGPPHRPPLGSLYHRGPKRGPGASAGPRARNALVGPPPPPLPPPSPAANAHSPQRREARPPPTPCKCSEQPPGHAAGHPPGGHP